MQGKHKVGILNKLNYPIYLQFEEKYSFFTILLHSGTSVDKKTPFFVAFQVGEDQTYHSKHEAINWSNGRLNRRYPLNENWGFYYVPRVPRLRMDRGMPTIDDVYKKGGTYRLFVESLKSLDRYIIFDTDGYRTKTKGMTTAVLLSCLRTDLPKFGNYSLHYETL